MNEEFIKQKKFWNREAKNFDSIYSHEKNKIKNLLDSIFRWDMYKRYEYAMEASKPISNRMFLDVGCGTGLYSLSLAKDNAQKVVGIDISETMIKICQNRANQEGLNGKCLFIQTDLINYMPVEKFDVCIGIGLFDYIKEPLPVLAKMKTLIRDKAIMSFPRAKTWRSVLRMLRLALKGCNVYFYTKTSIENLLKKAGFKKYDFKKIGQLYCVIVNSS
ncbi:MAG: class I SAM-dependent methyltransferase [Candidatus Omnitrophica bacterium]|nr:class I SAM-dependent methyltransferase [Candidatus Omnitrophota bacterium]